MLTIHQIKAARALLDWTQADLAKASGLHLNVINNIERSLANPRQNTLTKLQTALEENGIVLIANRGVELRRDAISITKFTGTHFLRDLTNNITATTARGDIVRSLLSDIRNFNAHDADAAHAYYAKKDEAGLIERLITRDMPGFYPRHSENYRVVAPDLLGPVDCVIYGPHTAHIFWDVQEILVLKNQGLALTQARLFDTLWAQGFEPQRTARH